MYKKQCGLKQHGRHQAYASSGYYRLASPVAGANAATAAAAAAAATHHPPAATATHCDSNKYAAQYKENLMIIKKIFPLCFQECWPRLRSALLASKV